MAVVLTEDANIHGSVTHWRSILLVWMLNIIMIASILAESYLY